MNGYEIFERETVFYETDDEILVALKNGDVFCWDCRTGWWFSMTYEVTSCGSGIDVKLPNLEIQRGEVEGSRIVFGPQEFWTKKTVQSKTN